MLAQRSPSDSGWAMAKVGLSVLGVTMGLVVASVAATSGRLAAALDTAWLSWVGTISYGIYVYHRPIGIWLDGRVASLIARTALLLVTAISIAALSWYLVERPILSLKRRWPMPRAGGTLS